MTRRLFLLSNYLLLLFFVISCCDSLSRARKKEIKKTDSEVAAIENLPKYEWVDDQHCDYKIKELDLVEGASRSFEVGYKNKRYVLLFRKQDDESLLTIFSDNKELWTGQVETLTTLHLGTVLIGDKQELWIETAENRPIYYKVELSPALPTVARLSFEQTHY